MIPDHPTTDQVKAALVGLLEPWPGEVYRDYIANADLYVTSVDVCATEEGRAYVRVRYRHRHVASWDSHEMYLKAWQEANWGPPNYVRFLKFYS